MTRDKMLEKYGDIILQFHSYNASLHFSGIAPDLAEIHTYITPGQFNGSVLKEETINSIRWTRILIEKNGEQIYTEYNP